MNTIKDCVTSGRVCAPSRTEDVKLSVFNIVTRINESKALAKHISCECKCESDGRKCNSNQNWNNDKCQYECKNRRKHYACEKDYIWNLSTCTCKNDKYLGSMIVDSVVICDEVIELTKAVPTKTFPTKAINTKTFSIKTLTNFDRKKVAYKIETFYILPAFLLITISLLIIVSIYCCLIKRLSKQEHLLPCYYMTNIM